MQETTEKNSEQLEPHPIGSSDTRSVAQELPTVLRVDGAEYTFTADSTPSVSEGSANSVEIEIPCLYCDTKNKLQYTGTLPPLISCSCSHCGEEVTLVQKDEYASISISTLVDELESYQSKRVAYLYGQSTDSINDRKVFLPALFLSTSPGLFCTAVFMYLTQTVQSAIADGTASSISQELAILYILSPFFAMTLVLIGAHELTPKVISWYLNIPGDGDLDTVSAFFNGNSRE